MRKRHYSGFMLPPMPDYMRQAGFYLFWIGIFVATLVVISVSIRIFREWDQRTWFDKEPLRVLVIDEAEESLEPESLQVVSVWPDTKKTVTLTINPLIHVGAVGGYGSYRLAALRELGKIEGVGDELLVDSVEALLGVPIHIVYAAQNPASIFTESRNQAMQQALAGSRSMAEAMDVWQLLSAVRPMAGDTIELTEANVVRNQTEADGSVVPYVEPALLDRLVMDRLAGRFAEAAKLQVTVVNATGKAQVASWWSRWIRASGFDVVSVTDQQEVLDQTAIVVGDSLPSNNPEIAILRHLLPRAVVTSGDVNRFRSDVAVIIGTDTWKWMNERETYLKSK